jgi:hypothetical protein
MANQDGTFMVWRGGITTVQSSTYPTGIRLWLVLRLEADAQEAMELHYLELRIVYEGRQAPWQRIPIAFKEVPQGETFSYVNVVASLGVQLQGPGDGRIQVMLDGFGGPPEITFMARQA